MKISEHFRLAFRTVGLAFAEVQIRFLVRSLSTFLFLVEAVLLLVPCLLTEAIFMTRESPFHRLADFVGRLSEKLDMFSDPDTGFRLF